MNLPPTAMQSVQAPPEDAKTAHRLPVFHHDFHEQARQATRNIPLRIATVGAATKKDEGRRMQWGELPDAEGLRTLARQIKSQVLDHLDFYLEQFAGNVRKNGGQVHFAATAAEAHQHFIAIARANNCQLIVKSKSMVSEEIELNKALEAAGLTPVETDLGELIVQLAHDRPSHLVMPVMHMKAKQIGEVFAEFFHVPFTDDPPTLAEMARVYLRERFHRADMGVSGVNFGIAETGSIVLVTNEGNGRMCTSRPRIHVALMGMEKLLPRFADLGVFLKLLARSATGMPMSQYTSIITGPRRPGEHDGPEQFHVVILDNGRRDVLATEYRDTLRCIRCGACLNACPVYRTIGGHAYGSVYPGPIGSLLTPLFNGLPNHPDLPQASSLCGACLEACPVQINIPEMLIKLRRDWVATRPATAADLMSAPPPAPSRTERLLFKLWTFGLASPSRYRLGQRLQRLFLRELADEQGWIQSLPGPAKPWTDHRDFPAPAVKTFRQLWQERQK
jgi:L-lactate dehydrogenase complex protein LldF